MKLSEYNTALSGMTAAQLGIAATKQNITNLHSDGYVRQKVNLGSFGSTSGNVGYGVKVLGVERITDEVKTSQYNRQLSELSYHEYISTELSSIEGLFNASGDASLSARVDHFFQAWHEVSKNPTQPTYYQTVVSEGVKLSSELNRISNELWRAKGQVQEDKAAQINEFNRLTEQLTETNKKIASAGSTAPNQLLDERDQIVKGLSKYAQIEATYESLNPNMVTIRINGTVIVSGTDRFPLESANGTLQVNGSVLKPEGGIIQAAVEMDQSHLSKYIEKMEYFSKGLADQINSIAGIPFFVGGTNALQVNPTFTENASLLAMPAEKAEQIANLENKQSPSGVIYQKAMDQLSVQVASDTNSAISYQNIHQELLSGIEKEKLSTEGVNLDEEMVNLMMYQNYFAANSKAIRTINEMYDSLFGILS